MIRLQLSVNLQTSMCVFQSPHDKWAPQGGPTCFLVPDSIFKTNCKLVFLQGFHQTYNLCILSFLAANHATWFLPFQVWIIFHITLAPCSAEKRPSPAASPKAKAPAEPAPKQAGRRGPGQHPSRASQAASSSTAVPPEACKWRPERKR